MKNIYKLILPMKGIFAIWIFLSISNCALSQDLCSTAPTLTSGATCSPTTGNLRGYTSTPGTPGTCGADAAVDAWYKFVAASPYPTITIGSIGSSLRAATPVVQILTGTCGALTSVACITGNTTSTTMTINTATVVGGAGLTVGQTYFIRIYSNSTATPAANWTYTVCITNPTTTAPAGVDYGKSYINVSKSSVGGTVEPGDTLEIRATMVLNANTAYNTSYADAIPVGSTYIPGTLRLLTNEGKIYKQFTDASDADPGTITGTALTINIGQGATATQGGFISNTSKPSFYGSTCIIIASFRIKINNTYNTTVNVGGGTFAYNNGASSTSGAPNVNITFFPYNIMVFKNLGICANSSVGGNILTNESGGTFGSGNIKDRGNSLKVPSNYTYAPFSSTLGKPNDYFYCVSNNTSGDSIPSRGYAISNTAWPIPDNGSPDHRIFGIWDIIGDHTGATNTALGNPPADTYNGQSGGYMVVINASYRTDTAFLDTIYNLCPNTYYQYTAWFRNICSRCGCDSNGTGASSSGYIPTAPGDSSGVYPNLTFNINGYDYYSTGNMTHTGNWVQKGFTYLTGPSQTTMVISIRNNAPGGGGNDWAIDDIGVATCSPSMLLTPNKPDTLCQGADDTVRFKVTSFFNNDTTWKLEKTINGGLTWTTVGADTTGAAATGSTPSVLNPASGLYEYLVSRYFRLNLLDTLVEYRITVASTVANLSNANCSFVTMSPKFVKAVNCNVALPTTIVNFRGQMKDGFGTLQWASADETGLVNYIVESSDDGHAFTAIGNVPGKAAAGQGAAYNFTDPQPLTGQRYYRIRITSGSYSVYSNQVLLSNSGFDFAIRSLINPFTDHINVDMTIPTDGIVTFNIVDMYGRYIRRERQAVTQGLNTMTIYGLGGLAPSTYALQIQYNDKQISNKVVKVTK